MLPVIKSEGAASITFSLPVMNAARHVVVAMTGASKAHAVKLALETQVPPGDFPAQMVKPVQGGQLTWVLDVGAASDLAITKGMAALL